MPVTGSTQCNIYKLDINIVAVELIERKAQTTCSSVCAAQF